MRYPVMRSKYIISSGKVIKNYLELTEWYKSITK